MNRGQSTNAIIRPGPAVLQAERAIQARDIAKTYTGNVRALQGLSFTVKAGTIFGLLGPNGAGKSTTVKILTTLSRPDAGEAWVLGFDVIRQPEQVRRVIGYVSQKTAVDLEATGRENLVLQGHLYGMAGNELRRRASELLDRFGLADASDRIAQTYSGGMLRKLDVAMGLVHRPQVLFLDEPTAGLDPEARAEMWREISHWSREDGLTILLTTHYLDEADHLADRVAIIDAGAIVAEGTPEELKSELRGDAIQVELNDLQPKETVLAALYQLGDGLREVTLDRRTLRARVDSGAHAIPAVLAVLETAGITALAATVARPSLDDVYLRHVGRAFNDADKGEAR